MLAYHVGGRGSFPHLTQISIVDISGILHRYLYIKDICDVIIQYKVHNGNQSVYYLQRKIIEEN